MSNLTKISKKKLGIFVFTIFLILATIFIFKMEEIQIEEKGSVPMRGIISPSSFDPNDSREIGYEFLDNDAVVHIWNTQDNYYFNRSSGIQFTNHFQDYWSKNIFCIGYYSGDTWNKIKCADEVSNFNRDIHTDNLTYVNATLWKDISYETYDLRLAINYYLGLDDENLTITIYGKNIGIDIPSDLGFAWKVKDVEIPKSIGNDFIDINNSRYDLDGTYDLLFKNMTRFYVNGTMENPDTNETFYMTIPNLELSEYGFLRIGWDANLNYAVKMYGDGNQSNFYVILLVDAGHFNPGQEKSTKFSWIDGGADAGVTFTVDNTGYGAGLTIVNEENPATASFTCTRVILHMIQGEPNETDNVYVGSFFGGAGTWENRDYEELGVFNGGIEQEFTGLSIDFQSGDVIGMFDTSGYLPIEAEYSGYSGIEYKSGNQFGAGEQSGYTTSLDDDAIYLYCDTEADYYPQWQDNRTNSTVAGSNVQFSVNWTDDENLSSYVFGWYNGSNWTQLSDSADLETGDQSFVGAVGGSVNTTLFFDSADSGWDPGSCPAVHPWDTCDDGSGSGQLAAVTTGPEANGTVHIRFEESTNAFLIKDVDTSTGGYSEIYLDFYWAQDNIDPGETGTISVDSGVIDTITNADPGTDNSYEHNVYRLVADEGITPAVDTEFRFDMGNAAAFGNNEEVFIDGFWVLGETTGSDDTEENKTAVEYSNVISGLYKELNNFTVIVNITDYNNSGSIANGNVASDLWLEVYNGTGWVEEGSFSVTTEGNYSITVTSSDVIEGWQTEGNRDFRIFVGNMDYDGVGSFDIMNWSDTWAIDIFNQQEFLNDSVSLFSIAECVVANTTCFSNITKFVTSDTATIKWHVWANDSVGQSNKTDTFEFTTTGVTDTCSCATINTNWEIDLTDACQIYTDCDIGYGNISFINTGTAEFNATITAENINPPPDSGGTLFIGSECVMNLG